MYMFVNENNVVIVDDETFSERLINRIKRKRMHQGETKERFLYNYIAEFMSRDLEILVAYELSLIHIFDARVPLSSRNPDIDELGKNKARLILRCV